MNPVIINNKHQDKIEVTIACLQERTMKKLRLYCARIRNNTIKYMEKHGRIHIPQEALKQAPEVYKPMHLTHELFMEAGYFFKKFTIYQYGDLQFIFPYEFNVGLVQEMIEKHIEAGKFRSVRERTQARAAKKQAESVDKFNSVNDVIRKLGGEGNV